MRILKISSDGREISWELKRAAGESPAPAAARGAAAGGENVVFSLNEIRTVRRAIPVASVPKVHAERCFTLVVNSRAVVFEAIDAATRELIVDGAPARPPPPPPAVAMSRRDRARDYSRARRTARALSLLSPSPLFRRAGFSLMLRYLQQLKAEQKPSTNWMSVK